MMNPSWLWHWPVCPRSPEPAAEESVVGFACNPGGAPGTPVIVVTAVRMATEFRPAAEECSNV